MDEDIEIEEELDDEELLDEEELDDDLVDDEIEGEIDPEVVVADDEDGEDEDGEVPKALRKRPGTPDDEDDDDGTIGEDDVEADLDTILKDRIAAGSDDDEDEAEAEEKPEPGDTERVAAKTAEEFSCATCFMIVHPRQFGRKDHLTCPEGYDPCPSVKEVEKRLKKSTKK